MFGPFVKGFQSEIIGHGLQKRGPIYVDVRPCDRVQRSIKLHLSERINAEIDGLLQNSLGSQSSIKCR